MGFKNAASKEPVAFVAVAEAALAVAISFGLDLTGQQVGALMALVAVVGGLLARHFVSPTVSVSENLFTPLSLNDENEDFVKSEIVELNESVEELGRLFDEVFSFEGDDRVEAAKELVEELYGEE